MYEKSFLVGAEKFERFPEGSIGDGLLQLFHKYDSQRAKGMGPVLDDVGIYEEALLEKVKAFLNALTGTLVEAKMPLGIQMPDSLRGAVDLALRRMYSGQESPSIEDLVRNVFSNAAHIEIIRKGTVK